MIWGPFLLALALGLVVSAGLYFAYLWPQVEPEDPAPEAPADSGAADGAANGAAGGAANEPREEPPPGAED